ncbi:endoribonuclease Dicer [Hylaeus volcanicus]|uniref:endoribonuclease Dicer n=1 Tax=Hylaeus volcanicus TaxID=313075 RepID=UPI0023B87C1E|nr:endoribonuclease Dicer [Hylaeus volcanicus]
MEYNTDEFTPRAYQIDLYEIARKQNTIIYLPTGAGKTFIAVLLIKELSADIRKPYNEGGKHTIFIVNTVPLVTQQSGYICRLTGLSCGMLSGDLGVDFWNETEWMNVLNTNQVLVMTSQILVDAISHGHIFLNRVNLIIFDECHRGVHDHPMRQIMKLFENCPIEQQPKVLGLSASLLNCNVQVDKIQQIIRNLEVTFNAKIATVNSIAQVKNYFASPKEIIVEFDNYVLPDVGQRINNIIDQMKEILHCIVLKCSLNNEESSKIFQSKTINEKLICLLSDIQEQFMLTGIYGASKCVLLHLIQLECIKKNTESMDTTYVLEYLVSELTKFRKMLEVEMEDNTEINKIQKYSSNQVLKLLSVLKNFKNTMVNDQKFCCIIFVQRRFTAKVLYQILKNLCVHDEEYKFLQPEFVVGFSNNPYRNSREVLCNAKWNRDALHRFKNGLSNCVIATDVVDEGIDIPKCTLIVRYNLPMDIRAYIQSKGRARYIDSQYTLLVPRNNTEYLKRYQNFKMIELYLQELLIGTNPHYMEPTQDEIRDKLYVYNINPYIVKGEDGTTCTITEQTAIGLLNRYCDKIWKSKFMNLTPIWALHEIVLENKPKLYKISLKLPVVSPLKTEIFGDAMESISIAKRSVAMKACIELHKIGELSDRLLPNTMNAIAKKGCNLFPNWVDEEESENELTGTHKKKRHHPLQFPSALYGAYPLPNESIYLHLLHIKPVYSSPHDTRHLVFYNLLSNNAGFAIISSKEMPKIPSFPVFMNVGELNVNIKVNYASMKLSAKQIQRIKVFHTLIFSEIVPVIKSFMVFDNYNQDNCFLIVPVDENWEINWDVMNEYQSIERIPPPVPFHIRNSDYELALVVPNYRVSPAMYLVTEVCEDLTPGSCFPTDNFFTYAHYYKQKHDLIINNLKQPMLEVHVITRKINFIQARNMQNESKRRKRTELPKDLKEHLVPELCTRIKFPALYWLKATMLPSILHRVSQLLNAEDLRSTIAAETGLGSISIQNEWPSLKILDEETDESFESLVEVPIDENMENPLPEPVLEGPEIDVLNTEAFHYPWTKDQEPPDLDRNIEDIQMIQIEHFCQFMSGTCNETVDKTMKNKRVHDTNELSIPVHPLKILSLNNSSDGPSPVDIMYALTTKGHDAFNLERLETLGDSYLKFIVSLFLYDNFPCYSEGPLTSLKGKLIGNRNLYYCGEKKRIPGRMKVDDFVPFSNFIAPGYAVFRLLQKLLLNEEISPNVLYEIQIPEAEQFTGHISDTTFNIMQEKVSNWKTVESQTGMEHYLGIQSVSDKTVADCVEALIGVYLKSMGIKDTVTLLKWFKILPRHINGDILLFDKSRSVVVSETVNQDKLNYFMPWASDIETKLGYKFKNRAYLLQAFTHPSYTANNITECYQRLEFLGDAILDFLITCYIHENCENFEPGALTDLRSALVNNITFACIAVRYGLHGALLAYGPSLNDAIYRFVKFQDERNHVVNDELLWILLEEDECKLAEYVDVPKVLGDLFESTIGAVYLDCDKNLTKVWEIIYRLMHKEIHEFSKNTPKQPIRVLYETQGARPQFLSAVEVDENVVTVPLKVIIDGEMKLYHGFGTNKKQAKCAAAKQALKSLLCKT